MWRTEDLCVILGLRPAATYDITWARIAKTVRDPVPGERRLDTDRQLADALLLTYALRNADRHANNLAQLSTSRADVHRSPAPTALTRWLRFIKRSAWLKTSAMRRCVAQHGHSVFHCLLESCGAVPSSIRHQLGSRRCTARCA